MSGFDSHGYGNDGGGFNAGSQSNDQSGGGRGNYNNNNKGPRDPYTFTPVTGRQVAMADMRDGKCRIDGVDAPQVSLVGQLHSVEGAATYVSFVIDDGTGDVRVKMSIRGEGVNNHDGLVHVTQFNYVKIHGKVSEGNGVRAVVATHVQKINDFNLLSFHALDALHCHLIATQGLPPSSINQSDAYQQPIKQSPYGTTPSMNAPQSSYGGRANDRDRVLAAFNAAIGEIGASVFAVADSTKLPLMRIREIVRELSEEGMVYVTQDEDHYKSVDV